VSVMGSSDTLHSVRFMSRIASSMSAIAKRWVIRASASIAAAPEVSAEVSSQVEKSGGPVTRGG